MNEAGKKCPNFSLVNSSSALKEQLKKEYPTQESGRIKSVENREDLIIGSFQDKQGYDGFMITNFSDPAKNLKNEVKVTFKNAKKAVVYAGGTRKVVDLVGGTYATTLNSGEGHFIIPFN